MGKLNLARIDFRRHPYRGILAEIAREDGVERQAVQKRMKKGDPDTLERISTKMRERKAKVDRYKKVMRSVGGK